MNDPAQADITVLLVGDGPTAPTALLSLVKSCSVLAVARSGIGASDALDSVAEAHGIPFLRLRTPGDLSRYIAETRPQAVVVSSFNQILAAHILQQALFINVHYSLLPHYRGRANVNWAMINGERSVGISIHKMMPGLDDGNILFQAELEISSSDTVGSLYQRLNAIQERELGHVVIEAVRGDPGTPQDRSLATYGCGRNPDDGEIDWYQSSAAIDRKVRALAHPFPGAFTHLGLQRLVIHKGEPVAAAPNYRGRIAGRVVGREAGQGWVDVLTGDGIFRIMEVGIASGEVITGAAVIKTSRATLGLSHLDLLRCIESLEKRIDTLEAYGSSSPHVAELRSIETTDVSIQEQRV